MWLRWNSYLRSPVFQSKALFIELEIQLFPNGAFLCILLKPWSGKKANRKIQEALQAEVAANPWYQEEEKKWYRLKCA